MGSWPIILSIFAVGFGLGALWQHHSVHYKYYRRALELSPEVQRELSSLARRSRQSPGGADQLSREPARRGGSSRGGGSSHFLQR